MPDSLPDKLNILVMMDEAIDVDAIRATAPDRLVVTRESPGTFADAGGMYPPLKRPAPQAGQREDLLHEAHVLLCDLPFPLRLRQRMPALLWVEFTSAGVSDFAGSDLWGTDVRVTSGRGLVQALPIAEMVIANALAFAKELGLAQRQAQAGAMDSRAYQMRLIAGKTMGIVGLGGIGQEVARLAKGLGMRVVATRHSTERRQEDVDGADVLYPAGELHAMLGASDFVTVCAPLTAETQDLLDADAFAHMKDGAFVLNVARGELIDEAALKQALRSGKLGGAYLDVYVGERTGPPDPELLAMPNVLMTPHNSGETDVDFWPVVETFNTNLQRFLAGKPLNNEVDYTRGS